MLHTKNRKLQGSSKKASFKANISTVSFLAVSIDKVKDIIKTLNTCDVPVKLIKINEDIFSRLIFQNFNQSLVSGKFPHCLKLKLKLKLFLSLKIRKNVTNPTIDL